MNSLKRYVIGIDLGGTKIAAGIIDLKNGKILIDVNIPTEAQKGRKAVIDKIKKSIYALIQSSKIKITAIGIGIPGPILYKKGIVINPPNLPGWKHVNLKNILEKEFKLPIFVDNDANCAALGEAIFGAGKHAKDFIYLTISTGIGGGIIIDRKLYRGKDGSAGEFGHMIIDPKGFKCGCGNYGDFESMASGTSVKTRSNENAMAIHIKAQQQDKYAISVIQDTAKYLGIGLVNIVNIFNPELIVIGGGLSNLGEMLLSPARSYVKKHALSIPKKSAKIVRAKLGATSGVLGAAALCL